VKKTGRLIVADTNISHHGIAAMVISKVLEQAFYYLVKPPVMLDACEDNTDLLLGTQTTTEAISIAKTAIALANKESRQNIDTDAVVHCITHSLDADLM
jgi:pyruvate/2-oxoglutarate/acetoin dehydrogenase E1 component